MGNLLNQLRLKFKDGFNRIIIFPNITVSQHTLVNLNIMLGLDNNFTAMAENFRSGSRNRLDSLFKIENRVLRARSEMISSAIDQICSWFQVSGVSKYQILNPEH